MRRLRERARAHTHTHMHTHVCTFPPCGLNLLVPGHIHSMHTDLHVNVKTHPRHACTDTPRAFAHVAQIHSLSPVQTPMHSNRREIQFSSVQFNSIQVSPANTEHLLYAMGCTWHWDYWDFFFFKKDRISGYSSGKEAALGTNANKSVCWGL